MRKGNLAGFRGLVCQRHLELCFGSAKKGAENKYKAEGKTLLTQVGEENAPPTYLGQGWTFTCQGKLEV